MGKKMSSLAQRRKKKFGGLHLNLSAGESFEIHHNDECLKLCVIGKNGTNTYGISVNGPKSFRITTKRFLDETGDANE